MNTAPDSPYGKAFTRASDARRRAPGACPVCDGHKVICVVLGPDFRHLELVLPVAEAVVKHVPEGHIETHTCWCCKGRGSERSGQLSLFDAA